MIEKLIASYINGHSAAELAVFADKAALQSWLPKALQQSMYDDKVKEIIRAFIGDLDFDKIKSEMTLQRVKEA